MGLITGGPEPRIDQSAMVKKSQVGEWSCVDRDSVVLESTVGSHCGIERRNLLNNAVVGDMTYTGADTSIMWATVGRYCCISRQVDIGGNEHNWRAASMMPTYRVKRELAGKLVKHHDEEPVKVGNDVWIGQGVSIVRKPGLTVGDGAVIGAGAVVTKSVPPYAIAVGVPARVVRYRFSDKVIALLEEARWWDWPQEAVLAHWDLLSGELDEDAAREIARISKEIG